MIRGNLELVSRRRVQGWLQDTSLPDAGIPLGVFDNGALVAQLVANRYRADLERAGIARGRHGFALDIPGGLSPLTRHVVQVRLERDGSDMPGSPCVIEPARSFDSGLEQAVSDAITALDGGEAERRARDFMTAQTERLHQKQADAEGQRAERAAHAAHIRRWGPKAAAMAEAAGLPAAGPGLRALVLDLHMPARGRDAGSEAILSHIRALRRLGYAVSFAAIHDMAASDSVAWADGAVTVCRAPVYNSAEEVLRRQASCFDLVYLHRVDVAARDLALVRHYNPRAKVVYSVADLHHIRLARQAEIEDRPDLRALVPKVRRAELHAAAEADAVITHSHAEAALLRQAAATAKVHVVPWNVPVRAITAPFAARHGLAFIGCFGHEPNVDAAHFLVEQVMPLVWRQHPRLTCLLVGPGAPPSVQSLASAQVIVTGQVADLGAELWDRVRLTAAPLRYGAGIKGKVLDSFAAGIPCAMTAIAAEGLALPAALQALVAYDAARLAKLIGQLHEDEILNRAASAAGQSMMRQHFSETALDTALRAAIEGRPEPGAPSGQGRRVNSLWQACAYLAARLAKLVSSFVPRRLAARPSDPFPPVAAGRDRPG